MTMKLDKNNKTLKLVFSALMIAIGTVLSLIKVQGLWAYGGGVTICAMLPLVVVAWVYGTRWGVFTAFVFALLQMFLGMDNVLYGTNFLMMAAIAILDYLGAYTVCGLAAVTRGKFGNRYAEIACGTMIALFLRFVCHFFSGWLIWDALWPNEFSMIGPVYSIVYNGSYMLPEIIITAVAAVVLERILRYSNAAR